MSPLYFHPCFYYRFYMGQVIFLNTCLRCGHFLDFEILNTFYWKYQDWNFHFWCYFFFLFVTGDLNFNHIKLLIWAHMKQDGILPIPIFLPHTSKDPREEKNEENSFKIFNSFLTIQQWSNFHIWFCFVWQLVPAIGDPSSSKCKDV